MKTRFFIVLHGSCDGSDAVAQLLGSLETMLPNAVQARWAMAVDVYEPETASALERILRSAGREFHLVIEPDAEGKDRPADVQPWLRRCTDWLPDYNHLVQIVPMATAAPAAAELPGATEEEKPKKRYQRSQPGDNRPALAEKICGYCGETYIQRRRDQQGCGKTKCKKLHQREQYAQQKVAEALAQQPDPILEKAASTGTDSGGDQPARPARMWCIVDGPRSGKTLTTKQLETDLVLGKFTPGQQLEHPRLGARTVVPIEGKISQRLCVPSGEG